MDVIEMTLKKNLIKKGFLTQDGRPTQNSLIMFFVYLKHLPPDWNIMELHNGSIKKVREYFGTDYGFSIMIKWGIDIGCSKSRSSDKRHLAMSLAYHDAKGMVGQGYVFTNLKP